MIDLTTETPVSLGDVARMFSVRPGTVRKWMRRTDGPRLEAVKLGGLLYTSMQAIQRFGKPCEVPLEKLSPLQRRAHWRGVLNKHGVKCGEPVQK